MFMKVVGRQTESCIKEHSSSQKAHVEQEGGPGFWLCSFPWQALLIIFLQGLHYDVRTGSGIMKGFVYQRMLMMVDREMLMPILLTVADLVSFLKPFSGALLCVYISDCTG